MKRIVPPSAAVVARARQLWPSGTSQESRRVPSVRAGRAGLTVSVNATSAPGRASSSGQAMVNVSLKRGCSPNG